MNIHFWWLVKTKGALLLVGLLCVVGYCYYPALASGFFLDDFYNLSGLAQISQNGISYYITSGFAGPSGRPLSLWTFALQHGAWPDDPFAFKLVNLFLHLVCGVLIFLISRLLLRCLNEGVRLQTIFALLVTAIWLLHPFHLTTVLYTVQRMTQLACLFSLLGVYGYLRLRIGASEASSRINYYLLTMIVCACTLAAILAKENGILTLLFIIIIEATLLSKQDKPKRLKQWMALFLVLPLLLLCAYLVASFEATLASYHFRPFTMGERLLTEPVVLLTYLKNIVLPVYGVFNLFHDDFPISTGLFSPPVTFFALLVILCSFCYALFARCRNRVVSFTILWFLGGHLLESSYLNLELYFEHRNYLPSFGIIFGVVYAFLNIGRRYCSHLVLTIFVSLYLILIVTVFLIEKDNWTKPLLQAVEWVRLNPQSAASVSTLAVRYIDIGEFEQAAVTYRKMATIQPNTILPKLQILRINSCERGIVDHDGWQDIMMAAASAKPEGQTIVAALDLFIVDGVTGRCQDNTLNYLDDLLQVLLKNQHYDFLKTHFYKLVAVIKLNQGDDEQALHYINQRLQSRSYSSDYVIKFMALKRLQREDEFKALQETMQQQASQSPRQYSLYHETMRDLDNMNINELNVSE